MLGLEPFTLALSLSTLTLTLAPTLPLALTADLRTNSFPRPRPRPILALPEQASEWALLNVQYLHAFLGGLANAIEVTLIKSQP